MSEPSEWGLAKAAALLEGVWRDRLLDTALGEEMVAADIARALDAAKAERERCAAILDEQARELSVYRDQWPLRDEYKRLATAIRARGRS